MPRVVIHHSAAYEWGPVPDDVVLTEQDITSGKVRPAARVAPGKPKLHPSNWTMRITKTFDTYTEVHVAEAMIFHTAMHRDVRPLRLTRGQALVLHIDKYIVPERFPRGSITHVEIDDDGPNETDHRALLDACDAVDAASGEPINAGHAEHMAAYLEPAVGGDHAAHLAAHLAKHFKAQVGAPTRKAVA